MSLTMKAARVNAGFTQADVAKQLNTSIQSINLWETGKSAIKAKTFKKLCRLYNVPMDDIILP